jgi:hypothetical protein
MPLFATSRAMKQLASLTFQPLCESGVQLVASPFTIADRSKLNQAHFDQFGFRSSQSSNREIHERSQLCEIETHPILIESRSVFDEPQESSR